MFSKFLLFLSSVFAALTTITISRTTTITRTLVVEEKEEQNSMVATRYVPDGRGGFIEGQLIPPVSAVILES